MPDCPRDEIEALGRAAQEQQDDYRRRIQQRRQQRPQTPTVAAAQPPPPVQQPAPAAQPPAPGASSGIYQPPSRRNASSAEHQQAPTPPQQPVPDRPTDRGTDVDPDFEGWWFWGGGVFQLRLVPLLASAGQGLICRVFLPGRDPEEGPAHNAGARLAIFVGGRCHLNLSLLEEGNKIQLIYTAADGAMMDTACKHRMQLPADLGELPVDVRPRREAVPGKPTVAVLKAPADWLPHSPHGMLLNALTEMAADGYEVLDTAEGPAEYQGDARCVEFAPLQGADRAAAGAPADRDTDSLERFFILGSGLREDTTVDREFFKTHIASVCGVLPGDVQCEAVRHGEALFSAPRVGSPRQLLCIIHKRLSYQQANSGRDALHVRGVAPEEARDIIASKGTRRRKCVGGDPDVFVRGCAAELAAQGRELSESDIENLRSFHDQVLVPAAAPAQSALEIAVRFSEQTLCVITETLREHSPEFTNSNVLVNVLFRTLVQSHQPEILNRISRPNLQHLVRQKLIFLESSGVLQAMRELRGRLLDNDYCSVCAKPVSYALRSRLSGKAARCRALEEQLERVKSQLADAERSAADKERDSAERVAQRTGKRPLDKKFLEDWQWECKQRQKAITKGYSRLTKRHAQLEQAEQAASTLYFGWLEPLLRHSVSKSENGASPKEICRGALARFMPEVTKARKQHREALSERVVGYDRLFTEELAAACTEPGLQLRQQPQRSEQ
eukprot:TRINITY_DN17322_c0_g1_i1.p1 TRINITY_DN17322_c0_g1~~TRINITY_DN17322_c0_g1_i1.p1  ORF type:complete len:762 (+),score=189.89 TRINITY_DN17322_c0_g1_i1:105-2288(+)